MAMSYFNGKQILVRIVAVTRDTIKLEDAGGQVMEYKFSPPERQKIVAGFSK